MRIPKLIIVLSAAWSIGVASAGLDDLLQSADELVGKAPALGGDNAAAALSDVQIEGGLKEALSLGAERAVGLLGRSGGFSEDSSVRIPLPGVLDTAAKGLRVAGQGQYVDAFETTVNRAAEQAIPQTLEIVKQTVRDMSLEDVRGIFSGGDAAATEFLRERAGGALHAAVLPIVSQATDQAGATAAYKSLAAQAGDLTLGFGPPVSGLVDTDSLDLDTYVTDKTLDGLFLKLAAEEKAIRNDPVARSTDILKTVFGN